MHYGKQGWFLNLLYFPFCPSSPLSLSLSLSLLYSFTLSHMSQTNFSHMGSTLYQNIFCLPYCNDPFTSKESLFLFYKTTRSNDVGKVRSLKLHFVHAKTLLEWFTGWEKITWTEVRYKKYISRCNIVKRFTEPQVTFFYLSLISSTYPFMSWKVLDFELEV